MADLLVDGESDLVPDWYAGKYRKSKLIADAYEATDFFPTLGNDGKWLSFTVAAIRDSEGNVIGAVETLEDITEQKRAEEELFKSKKELEARVAERTAKLLEAYEELESELQERGRVEDALRQSELKFRTVADYNYDWEYWVDSEGNFLYVSPSCERITGYSTEEFINDPDLMDRIVHPDDLTEMLDHYHNVRKVAPHAVDAMDFRVTRRDGETRWIGHVCQPVYGGEGQTLGRRVSNRDITDRKRAEDALRKSQENYRLLAENTLDVIWQMDLDLRFTYVNPAILQITGYTPDEWIGTRLEEHCDEENFRKMAQVASEEISKGADSSGAILEAVMLNKNRQPFSVEISGKIIFGENGLPMALQGITRDITERKRAEEALSTE